MPFLTGQRVLSRRAGYYKAGSGLQPDRPVYASSLPRKTLLGQFVVGERHLARYWGWYAGRPLYVSECCRKDCDGRLFPGSRHLAKLTGWHQGRPLYVAGCRMPCWAGQQCGFFSPVYLVPCTLYATVAPSPECTLVGPGPYTVPVTWVLGGARWAASFFLPGPTAALSLAFRCGADNQATLQVECASAPPVTGTYTTVPSGPPLVAVFSVVLGSACCGAADGQPKAATVVITETPP